MLMVQPLIKQSVWEAIMAILKAMLDSTGGNQPCLPDNRPIILIYSVTIKKN